MCVPWAPVKSAAETESALEALYRDLTIYRYICRLEPAAPLVISNTLEAEVDAERAYAVEATGSQRTKMVLARALEKNDCLALGEDLKLAWRMNSLTTLQARDGHLLPAP